MEQTNKTFYNVDNFFTIRVREVHTQILFYRLLLVLKALVIMFFKVKMKANISVRFVYLHILFMVIEW